MNRAIVLLALLACAPLVMACEKSAADEQARANEAQEQANKDLGRANAQANEAQQKANEKIAAAEADFIKLREDYRSGSLRNLDAIDRRIAELDVRAAAGPRSQLKLALVAIHAQRDVFANDLRSIDAASAATFDAAKAKVDKDWADLKAAVDKAS